MLEAKCNARTAEVKLEDGQIYLAVFSNSVIVAMEDAGIDLSELAASKPVGKIISVVTAMINAGSEYAGYMGMARPDGTDYPKISSAKLSAITGQDDFDIFVELITTLATPQRHVDATPKNVKTTRGRKG